MCVYVYIYICVSERMAVVLISRGSAMYTNRKFIGAHARKDLAYIADASI